MACKEQIQSLTEETTCSICLDFFTDPVTLQCTHNFCRSCVDECWEKDRYFCPECRHEFPGKRFRINRALANLAEKLRKLNLAIQEQESKIHCEKHQEELKLFCDTDQKLICVNCVVDLEHRGHSFLPLKEAVEVYKVKLKSSLEDLTEKKLAVLDTENVQKRKISEVRKQASSLRTRITSEFTKMHQIVTEKEQRLLRDLREEEERIVEPMEKNLREIQEKLNSIEVELSKLQEQMEQKDALMFLKEENYQSTRCSDDHVTFSEAVGSLSIEKFNGPLQYTVWREMIDNIHPAPASLTLDPNTANAMLILSEDLTSVRFADSAQSLPDTPERFDFMLFVLGSEGFTSGRYYWELEVGEKTEWIVGVVRESVDRKEGFNMSPESGYWTVGLDPRSGYFVVTSPSEIPISLSVRPRKIGIYLDYESGQISFYNAGNMSHIHTFSQAFTERIFPFFYPGVNNNGKNSAPLTICQFKDH